jgi:hypothetical protein
MVTKRVCTMKPGKAQITAKVCEYSIISYAVSSGVSLNRKIAME